MQNRRMMKLYVLLVGISAVNVWSFYSRNPLLRNGRRHFLPPAPELLLLGRCSVRETEENHDELKPINNNNSNRITKRRNDRRVAVSLTDTVEEAAGRARVITSLPAERRRNMSSSKVVVHEEEHEDLPVKPQIIDARSQVSMEDELVPDTNPRWYVLKVKVGKERYVCDTIEQNIESWDLREMILEVVAPSRQVTKTARKKLVAQNVPLHPGYVYIKCLMSERLRDLVTRLPPVAGFMGRKKDKGQVTIPMPADDTQIQCLLNDVEAGKYFIDTFEVIHGEGLEIGDMVKIMNGSYRGQIGFLDIVREEEVLVRLFISGQSSYVPLGHRDIRKVHWEHHINIMPHKLSDEELQAEMESISLAQQGRYAAEAAEQ